MKTYILNPITIIKVKKNKPIYKDKNKETSFAMYLKFCMRGTDGFKSWYLIIETLEMLCYYLKTRTGDIGQAYLDAKEFILEAYPRTHKHPKTELFKWVDLALKNKKFNTFVDDILYLEENRNSGFVRTFKLHGTLLFNAIGGYQPLTDNLKILETIEKEDLIFPIEKQIIRNSRILRWPGGKHYYAKVGNKDVVVDGEQKWDTRKAVEEAIEIFLNNRREL